MSPLPMPPEYLDPARIGECPLATALLKVHCQDFRVQELPLYVANGTGEHLFLWVRKQDVSASHLIHVLSQQLKVRQADIGIAGQKDRRAITEQYVSVPVGCESKVASFTDERIQILRTCRHTNKLRTGHLQGNRFQVILRSPNPPFPAETCDRARLRLLQISAEGFPNYYGEQRFGRQAESVHKGVQLLDCTSATKKAFRTSRFEKKMLVSAVQSAVFNWVVSGRVRDRTWSEPIDGDVVCRRDGIRPFLYTDRNVDSTEQLIPMGPMRGPKMLAAEGQVLQQERAVLAALQLTEACFHNKKLTPGARRPMVAWPSACYCEATECGSLRLGFDLPAGSYATVLLREIVKELRTDVQERS